MKKIKFLTSIMAATTAITPLFFGTSCAKNNNKTINYEPLTAEFKQQAINEFITLVKTPHVTGRTRAMADMLKTYFEPYIEAGSWYEDGYRNSSSPDSSSGNICFDIKATEGCETWPGVTLQGHYDMVGKGTVQSGDKGVDAVIDGNIMHSRHYQSTLGADDGIGLGIIATIVKNQDKFKHGRIHILLTSDEEADLSGAYTIPSDSYDMVMHDHLINLDAEADKKITVSCAGTSAITYKYEFIDDEDFEEITTPAEVFPYTIKVSGLKGGHSANCINEGRLSAIKVLTNILKRLNYNYTLKIISFKANNESTAIASEAEATFWVPQTTIGQIKNWVIDPVVKNYKMTNPIEDKLKVEISESYIDPEAQGAPKSYLSPQGSWKLYTLLNDIPFGPVRWLDESLKEVAVSNNIGDVSFTTITTSQQNNLLVKCFARSCIDNGIETVNEYIDSISTNIFGTGKVTKSTPDNSPAWKYSESNEMYDLFEKGFKQIEINPIKRNAHSWLECAYFCQTTKHKDAKMIAVGPLIKDAHSVNETLYLDTLDPLISSLLYTLKHINEV